MGSVLAWEGSARGSEATLDSCLSMGCCGWTLLAMGSEVGVAVVDACPSWFLVDSWVTAQRKGQKRKRYVGDAYFQMRADGSVGDRPAQSSLSGRRYACMASCAYVSQLGKSPKPAYQKYFQSLSTEKLLTSSEDHALPPPVEELFRFRGVILLWFSGRLITAEESAMGES